MKEELAEVNIRSRIEKHCSSNSDFSLRSNPLVTQPRPMLLVFKKGGDFLSEDHHDAKEFWKKILQEFGFQAKPTTWPPLLMTSRSIVSNTT